MLKMVLIIDGQLSTSGQVLEVRQSDMIYEFQVSV